MSFEVNVTPRFNRAAKALLKRYPSFKEDIAELINTLTVNPFQGDELTSGIRKIRLTIKSKGKGKSGGARVITYTIVISENMGQVYMIDLYDKADYSTVDVNIIKQIIRDLEL